MSLKNYRSVLLYSGILSASLMAGCAHRWGQTYQGGRCNSSCPAPAGPYQPGAPAGSGPARSSPSYQAPAQPAPGGSRTAPGGGMGSGSF